MNLETEERLGYTIPAEMKKVWQVQMDLSEKLLDVCRRHGLQCWMDSGTLLGAVRHKGFIPWDDDIDFVMLRKDYDKLVSIAREEFQSPYVFQSFHTENDYFSGQAQLRHAGTTCLDGSELEKKYCLGIFIDIFVLDGFIENPVLRFLHRTATMVLRKTLVKYVNHRHEPWCWGDGFLTNFSKLLYAVVPYRKAYRAFENLFRAVDADKCRRVSVISYRYSNRRRIRNRHSYDTMVPMPFEDRIWPAPNDTRDALVCYFGEDYMTPRHEPAAHGHKYFDTERPYTELLPELKAHPERIEARVNELYTD